MEGSIFVILMQEVINTFYGVDHMIELKNVSKHYGSKKALDAINLTLEKGQIYGLLGHNGAGKSTTIKILVDIIKQSSGEILIDGQSIDENRLAVKQRIAYVSDSPDLFLQLKAKEYWDFIAQSYRISEVTYQKKLKELVTLFDIESSQDQLIETFSHGMRQKTFLIGALIANPEIWILDEPMTGLDPQAAYDLKQMMLNHAAQGNIVLFSTHALETAQELSHKLAILRKGHVLFEGSFNELQAQYPGESLEMIYLKMAGRDADLTEGNIVEESGETNALDTH